MEHLTYDMAWKLCIEQWDWMEEQGFGDIGILKFDWLIKHGYEDIHENCFFCHYAKQQSGQCSNYCEYCPPRKIDPNFQCECDRYHYRGQPHKFHAKIKTLYKEIEMDIKEAYCVMQAEWVKLYDVKVGTKVRVLRAGVKNELGSHAYSHAQEELNKHYLLGEIRSINPDYIDFTSKDIMGWMTPFFVLEVVGQPDVKEMTVKEVSEMAGCEVKIIK